MAYPCYWKASVTTMFLVLTVVNLIVEGDAKLHTQGLRNVRDRSAKNICPYKATAAYSITGYTTEVYFRGYTTCCGVLCWARCQRYTRMTRSLQKTIYQTRTDEYLVCCSGYHKQGDSCRAYCENGCSHGGTCESPNECRCTEGWTGLTCTEDKNECSSNNGGCQQICVNRIGTANVCTCQRGYTKDPSASTRCIDYDECRNRNICTCATGSNSADCGADCTNTVGSFSCSCGKGYKLLRKTMCVDVNECRWNGVCGQDKCINSPGSFYCLCRQGFHKVKEKCQDIDECVNNNGYCERNRSICENRPGYHRCICKKGFVLDGNGRTCSDIDECSGFHGCQETCINTVGDYHCECSKGYKLKDNQRTCTDIDECTAEKITGTTHTAKLAHCQQLCTNVLGSYQCSCREGYNLMYDKKRCKDVDECTMGKHLCDQICHNTDGSYRCSCSAGYKLGANGRTCEGLPCEQIILPRHGHMTCSGRVTNSTCSFSCSLGYRLTGSQTRICQASSRWSGDRASCDAKHCKVLKPSVPGHSLFIPCFTSFGSKCYFGCARGFIMKGEGQASCSSVSESGDVSWKIGHFSCEDVKTCKPNPCKHGGQCKVQDKKVFSCDCEGTGYKGSKCQTGLISTPVFPKLSVNSRSGVLYLSARPSNKLNIFLYSEKGVVFYPSSTLEITFPEFKQEFSVEVEKAGIRTVSYGLGGPSKTDFEIPEKRVVLVQPRALHNDSIYSRLFVQKGELPVGCNEHVSRALSCELTFLSTEGWTGSSPATNGIVHIRTRSNQYIPLSMVGLNLDELQVSKKSMIQAAVAHASSNKPFSDFYINDKTCIQMELSSDNLLELMNDDALVSSFLRTFSTIAPGWLYLVTSELNEVFDIQNIAVNLAQKSLHEVEHCSGFPLSPLSSIAYFRPTVNYELRVTQDGTSLFAEGNTCFATDVCKQSVFINFSNSSANELKETLSVFRDMKNKGVEIRVDSVGLLGSSENYDIEEGAIWNGTHLNKASPFLYNMWLKGNVNWKMQIPAKLDVVLHITGESFIHYNNIEELFVDRLTRPLEMLLKGKVSITMTGRALGQEFNLELSSKEVIGKARLGGPDGCEDRVQGIFMSVRKSESGAFFKTPFYPYVRPAENQEIHVTILVKYNEGRQNKVANMAEIRRTLTHLRFLVPELEDILREAISTLPEDEATLQKWIQTTAMFNGKIREFRRTLFSNRAVDVKKVRQLTADINEKIDFLRKSVEIVKHRVSLKTITSPLLIMIEDFQFGFPHLLRLKLRGGSAQKRMHGVRIYFRSSICMKKLCFDDTNAVIAHHDGNRCGSQHLSETAFYVSGKASTMMPLSPGKILSISEGQPINIVFNRNSEHVSIEFEAWVRILGLRQSTNATLDKTQLSLKIKGDIFTKFPTEMNVVAKIKDAEDWNSLVFLVEGKMPKSSVLPNYLQEEIKKYVFAVTENAQSRIKKAETAIRDAKRKTEEAEKLLKSKQITLDNASKKLGDKMDVLTEKRIEYAQSKRQFNSTIMRYLRFKNQTVCEMKNCKYINLKTCIPKLCRKSITTTYTVPVCKKVRKKIDIVKMEKKETIEFYNVTRTQRNVEETSWIKDWKYSEKTVTTRKNYTKVTNVQVKTEKEIIGFDCTGTPKSKTVVSDHSRPYQCCNDDVTEKVQILDPQCVSHNSNCSDNMTEFAQKLTRRHNNESALFSDFQNMTEMGKQVNLAQMEVNIARTDVRMASNQKELARAFLRHQNYSKESINVTSVKKHEQLGIRLANKIKSLDGRALVNVESLSFSTSMTSTSKTLLPFVASVKTADGEHKFIEFPMDFKRIDYSLTSASKLVIKTLFGTINFRDRRSTRSELVDDALGQRMCFFSYQANAFFRDIINSLEFLLESTNVYFQSISSGLEEFDSHTKNPQEKSFSPNAQQLQISFTLMMQSLKDHYVDVTSRTTWESILEQWRDHLNVLTGDKNFTECSGSQDCVDYFFRNLDDFYQFEQSHRALEIKQQLHELKMIVVSLLQRNSSFAKVQEIAQRAKALLNNTNDDSVLCGTSPIIVKSSPAEVVVLAGDTANLTCLVENTTEVSISWMKNERVLEDMNGEVLFLRNANTQTEGAYKCEVSNNRGRTLSNVTIVMVHKAPSITEHPRDMRVLLGTDTVSMECSSNGLPRPSTQWFFMPYTDEVVRLNSSNRVLIKRNLTSQDSGFYYCNVSNIHGTVKSKTARLDVLGYTLGKPRVAVSLKFALCTAENFPENVSNCTDEHHTPALHLHYGDLHNAFGEIIRKMSWSWKQIDKLNFSPHPNVSVSFVITAYETNVQSDVSPGLIDALNSFSLSRQELARELQSFRSAIEEGKVKFLSKNSLIVARKGSFAARLFTQKCPAGKEADENGFLCVNCAPGYYGISNGSCLLCPVGTYQPNEKSRECFKCRYRRSLTELGAVLESQCIDISIPCNLSEATIEHAQAPQEKKDRYRTGETFVLGCEDGYKGIGNGTWECDEGNWTTHEFYCEKTCFPPWTELKKRCYMVMDVPSHRWKDAFAECQSLNGSQMVTITSEEENDFTAQLAKVYLKKNNMTQVQMWLGLRKVHVRAQFQWVDGRFLEAKSYTNWSPGEPNNNLGRELCAEMLVSGNFRTSKWNDVRCDTTSYKSITVCEKPLRAGD